MNMRDIILSSPEQITHSLEVNKEVKVDQKFDSIIFAGMGGSWHPGELLSSLNITNLPLFIHRSYGMAFEYTDNPLVIVSSYSGNTEEILTAYEAAKANGYGILINTSGGRLEEISQEENIPLSKIDYQDMQPRHTTFASFASIYIALKNSGLAQDITEDLKRITAVLQEKLPTMEKSAKALADNIRGTMPVYTASQDMRYAAWNFKIQTNENAKHPAFWNIFPELNHNELVGFSKLETVYAEGTAPNFHVIIIRDPDDHPRVQARMDVTKDLYASWGLKVSEVTLEGETALEKTFYAIGFGLWTTYHLADGYGIDPVPVEGVENFKAKLKDVAGPLPLA